VWYRVRVSEREDSWNSRQNSVDWQEIVWIDQEVVGGVYVNPEEIEYNLALVVFEYPRLKELG